MHPICLSASRWAHFCHSLFLRYESCHRWQQLEESHARPNGKDGAVEKLEIVSGDEEGHAVYNLDMYVLQMRRNNQQHLLNNSAAWSSTYTPQPWKPEVCVCLRVLWTVCHLSWTLINLPGPARLPPTSVHLLLCAAWAEPAWESSMALHETHRISSILSCPVCWLGLCSSYFMFGSSCLFCAATQASLNKLHTVESEPITVIIFG